MNRSTTMRLRAVAAVGVAALALTGCGRDAGGAEGGPGQGEAIDEGKATGTIEVWAMGTEGEELGEFTAAFEKEHPDAQVEVTAVPWDSAHTKIATAITSGKTPDVALIGTTWMGEFAETGGLEPTPEGLVDEADFFEGAWNSTVVGDTSYGVPWYVETRVLYYNKDLAQKAGWDEPPASWDELKQFATDLEKKAGAEYGISLPPGQTGSWQTMLPFAWSNGATLTDDAGSEYTIDSPETVEALEYYKTYFDEGLSPSRTLDPGELESGFADGTYGSFVSGPWHTGLVEEKGLTKEDYGLAVLPGPDGDQGTSFVGGGDLAVFSDSDNKESAWKFVQWLAQPEVQSDWYDHMGSLPAVRESWETGALSEDEQLAVFGRQLDTALSPPAVPTWEQVAAVIDAEVEKATKGTVPVEDAVSTMQEKAQSIGTGL